MRLVQVKPERIMLDLPDHGSIYISLGTVRDLMNELSAIFSKRVEEGKGLL